MKPADEARRELVRQWVLNLVAGTDRAWAESLREATALNPCGVVHRYPGEFPELTKEAATTALELAAKARAAVAPLLSAYLQPPCQRESTARRRW
jgi:hypothetical protein